MRRRSQVAAHGPEILGPCGRRDLNRHVL
jgi:hypothetical protein